MIRLAAVGDVHFDVRSAGRLAPFLGQLADRADLLLLAGDLTVRGAPDEAMALAKDLASCPVPVVAVLGNHDYHQDRQRDIEAILRERGVVVLEGSAARFQIRGTSIGIAGMKGFGGGYFGGCVTEFGESEFKAFARHAREQAGILRNVLGSLDTDLRIALTHYSPIEGTLLGEPRQIYPFLGSYLLAEAIDACGVQAAFHGHAHQGTEKGATRGGVPVRNVAQMVIGHAYNIYSFETTSDLTQPQRPVESPRAQL